MEASSDLRVGRAHCRVWRVDAPWEEVESILSSVREAGRGVLAQAFTSKTPPDVVALEMLAAQTISARRSGVMLANKPEFDLLLRLAGTRQIEEALARHGYKSERGGLYLVAAADERETLVAISGVVDSDPRLKEVPRRRAGRKTMEIVERAALLSCAI